MEKGLAVDERLLARRQSVPVLHVRGSHYDVGYDVGRTFGSIIKSHLFETELMRPFDREFKTEAGRAVYEKTLMNMKKRYPYYVKEIQGVADGANISFQQLFLLHLDDLVTTINDNHLPRNDTGGCSSIAIKNEQNVILGHLEDAVKDTLNHFYIVSAEIIPTKEDRAHGATEERFTSLCYAGLMPGYTMGYNQHGLVFSINTLSPLKLKPGNTPRTFITRKMLSARNYREAESYLRDDGLGIGNGFSVNMLWSDAWGDVRIYNVEVAPDHHADRSIISVNNFDKEPLIHCNKYEHLNVTEVNGPIIASSVSRLQAIRSHPQPRTRADVCAILSDTTGQDFQVFSRKKDAEIKTIAATIFDMDKRTWSVYIDPPHLSEPIVVLPIKFHKFYSD